MTPRAPARIAPGRVLCLDGLASADECLTIRDDLRFAWWWTSPLVRRAPGGRMISGTSYRRTSSTTSEEWMGDEAREMLRILERRIADCVGVDLAHLETWQATRYRRGERFDEHHDAGFFRDTPHGERTTTLLVYLDTHESGGSTVFPRLGKRFMPRAGRALVWANLLPDGSVDDRMRHEARPARSMKTVLTTWARQRPVNAVNEKEAR